MPQPTRAGVRGIWVDGTRVDCGEEVTYNLGGEVREGLSGLDGVHGYATKHMIPFVEFDMRDRGDLSVGAARSLRDTTVVVQLESGKTLALRNAWAAGEWQQTAAQGVIRARFEGMDFREAI